MIKKLVIIGIVIGVLTFSLALGDITVSPQAPNWGGGETTAGKILSVAQWVGYVISLGMVIFAGYKYLTAGAGSRAEVKSTMLPLLIGAFIIALAPTIAAWVFNMSE